MYFYNFSGFAVCSEIALPGLIFRTAKVAAPDITIRRGKVPRAFHKANVTGPTWSIEGGRFLLCVPGVARFLLSDGRDVVFESEAGDDATDIPVFIIGTVLGISLHQRDQIVFHASTVQVNGKAVLFCGASGAGKSTLAAALARSGFPLVTDDVCAVTIVEGVPMVHPDGSCLKLWAQAIDRLDLADSRMDRVRACLDKFYVETPRVVREAQPLGAVYALREARPPNAPGIERPNVVDASLILRRNAYRPLLVKRLGQDHRYFHAAATIANAAGIFYLTRPLDFRAIPEVVSQLENHWREVGLMECLMR